MAWRRLLLLPAAGALFALAFPRPGWWPLALVALAPLLVEMSRRDGTAPALPGVAWGFGFFGVLLLWLYSFFRHYGEMNPLLGWATLALLVAYLSLYPGLFSHFGSLILRRNPGVGMLFLPPLWVTLEWIRGHALSGFPWGIAGYALVPCLPLVQIGSVTGVYGVSFLVVLANLSAAAWIRRSAGERVRAWGITLATAVLFAGAAAYGALSLAAPYGEGPKVKVGLVQASIPQDEKWSASAARAILAKHESLTEEAAGKGARLILWPESSSPYPLSHPLETARGAEVQPDREYRGELEALSRRTGAALLVGTVDYRKAGGEVRPVNAAALVRPDGTWGRTYAKMHLVPFGEYVPMAPLLGFVNRMVEGAIGDFVPGRSAVVARADGVRVGTCICYEMVFPALVRQFPLHGADLLANLTNDAWFGTSSGPYQHFQMAVLRAVENRRYLVRAANTGISAIVDPRGRVLASTRLEETTVLLGEVRAVHGLTIYSRVGDLFAILCVILTSLCLAAACAAAFRSVREGKLGD